MLFDPVLVFEKGRHFLELDFPAEIADLFDYLHYPDQHLMTHLGVLQSGLKHFVDFNNLCLTVALQSNKVGDGSQ